MLAASPALDADWRWRGPATPPPRSPRSPSWPSPSFGWTGVPLPQGEPSPAGSEKPQLNATVLLEGLGRLSEAERPPDRGWMLSVQSLNPQTAGTCEVCVTLPTKELQAEKVLSVGRADQSTLCLSDARVSSQHFFLHLRRPPQDQENAPPPVLELVDTSTNGTWVNGQHVGKGNAVRVFSGDEVTVLPESSVGDQDKVAFVLRTDIPEATRRSAPLALQDRTDRFVSRRKSGGPASPLGLCSPWSSPMPSPSKWSRRSSPKAKGLSPASTAAQTAAAAEQKCKEERASRFVNELSAEISCSICTEILHNAVALNPCLHNFCTACYLDWRTRSFECPTCRVCVSSVFRNHALNAVTQAFVLAHPDAARTDVAQMERKEREHKAVLASLLTAGAAPAELQKESTVSPSSATTTATPAAVRSLSFRALTERLAAPRRANGSASSGASDDTAAPGDAQGAPLPLRGSAMCSVQ